jgi:poly-gamma-glutamate capsule biosynthesis protein CapA/YwtB (metallophosphatase superfamily)
MLTPRARPDAAPPAGSATTLTLMLAGDVMTGRGIDQLMAHPSAPGLHEALVRDARDYLRQAERRTGTLPRAVDEAYVWGDALDVIEQARPHGRIVNLETAVTTNDEAWPGKGMHHRMHPDNVGCLAAARLDCCVLANDHVLDWGRPGLDETLQTLRTAGIHTAGAGADGQGAWAPATLALEEGRRVLVFACAAASSGVPPGWAAGPRQPGIARLPDLSEATARDLAADAARHRRGDGIVVQSIHWGASASEAVPPEHRRFARRLVDLGAADIVHGHSSHHALPIEVYRGKLILYGCGDLINDCEGLPAPQASRRDVSCLYFATLDRRRGLLRRLQIVPMQLFRMRLVHADRAARGWLHARLNQGGLDLGTELMPDSSGSWQLQWGRSPVPA